MRGYGIKVSGSITDITFFKTGQFRCFKVIPIPPPPDDMRDTAHPPTHPPPRPSVSYTSALSSFARAQPGADTEIWRRLAGSRAGAACLDKRGVGGGARKVEAQPRSRRRRVFFKLSPRLVKAGQEEKVEPDADYALSSTRDQVGEDPGSV